MPRILLIKTSSIGDVARNHPVVSDLRASLPENRIDRIVEEVFGATTRLLEKM